MIQLNDMMKIKRYVSMMIVNLDLTTDREKYLLTTWPLFNFKIDDIKYSFVVSNELYLNDKKNYIA